MIMHFSVVKNYCYVEAERQAQRHRLGSRSDGMERVETLLEERDRMAEQLQQMEEQLRSQQIERQLRTQELQELRTQIAALQVVLYNNDNNMQIRLNYN
jgi:hypothetical protein